jgi:hypothetical protein
VAQFSQIGGSTKLALISRNNYWQTPDAMVAFSAGGEVLHWLALPVMAQLDE